MTADLRCYGDDIEAAAELVPDFDLRSPTDVQFWYTREWQAIADVLGFAQQLAAAPRAVPTTPDRIAAMTLAGLTAFEHALRASRPGVTDNQARVQAAVIQAMTAQGLVRGELWRVTADPAMLVTGACYLEGARSLRAFYPDTAPGYFGDGWAGPPPRAESACGWQTPLVLHLGTFPWVYSTRLGAIGAGMQWAAPASQPALEGLHVVASLLEPVTNLRQDARQVAAIYRHFVTHTAPLAARLPVFEAGRAVAGRLYRRGRLLIAHQGSLHIAALDGPRGRVAASPHRPTITSFAASPASSPSAARRCGPWRPSPSTSSASPRPRPTPACASRPRSWPVRAEYTPSGSTRGLALPYHAPMRTSTLLTLTLFMGPLHACGDDDAPTRPEDGTVDLWDACVWDGQFTRSLCQPELTCAWNGICVPRCDMAEECPAFEGFTNECGIDSEEMACKVRCTNDLGCPETGGAPLKCFQTYCVRDP